MIRPAQSEAPRMSLPQLFAILGLRLALIAGAAVLMILGLTQQGTVGDYLVVAGLIVAVIYFVVYFWTRTLTRKFLLRQPMPSMPTPLRVVVASVVAGFLVLGGIALGLFTFSATIAEAIVFTGILTMVVAIVYGARLWIATVARQRVAITLFAVMVGVWLTCIVAIVELVSAGFNANENDPTVSVEWVSRTVSVLLVVGWVALTAVLVCGAVVTIGLLRSRGRSVE